MTRERVVAPEAALSSEVLDYLRRDGVEVQAVEGERIVGRGEPGRALWVVLEGGVEVRLTGEDGVQLPLARMGAGAIFGEMSLISGDPVSADVVALSGVRLLRYPAERFASAVGECEPLRTLLLSRLARNLRGTSAEVWNFHQRAKALNVLVDPGRDEGPLVAASGAMKPVAAAVERLARTGGTVLVHGESGTGKGFVAAKIHRSGRRADSPLIAVDCRTLVPEDAMRFLLGSDAGLGTEEESGADGTLRRYGALQLAHRGTLVLRHADRLPAAVHGALADYLRLREEGRIEHPATRIVLTTDLEPARFAEAAAPLAAAAGERVVALPRLQQRRRDVVPLAKAFLERRAGEDARELSRGAEHALLSRRYAHRNVAELREAVEMAAVIADGAVIGAEHIFTGPKGRGTVQETDLSRLDAVGRLTSPRFLGALRAAVFASFAAIIAVSLVRSGARAGGIANGITWGLWEPALFVAFLLVGRVWCTVCPLSTAGRLAARLGSLGRTPGDWMKNHAGWLVSAGFLAVIWSEHAFDMTSRPRAAAFLLLALAGAAVFFAVVYRRETWCRYVCPLGNLGALFALPAVLGVRANPSVCATLCTTHECFKGSERHGGCPVFHHPLYASDASSCKLCFQCLRVCPNGSARLYLRLPLQSVWAQADVGTALVPFALFLLFFAPAMLAAQGAGWAATVPGFTATSALALGAAALLAPRLPRLLATGGEPNPAVAGRAAFALAVLAWGPAMAYQLAHVPGLGSLRLHAEPGTALAATLPGVEISVLGIAQAVTVLLAALAAAICLAGIRSQLRRDGDEVSRRGWRAIQAFAVAHLLLTLALLARIGGVSH